jgi:hypothetical protein
MAACLSYGFGEIPEMNRQIRPALLVAVGVLAAVLLQSRPAAQSTASATAPENAKTWLGHAAEIEAYLRTAEIIKTEGTAQGVTRPRKCTLAPGGPVGFLAFKPIPPGTYDAGFRESYKTEIAAYELDKLIHLDMVPPTVEKTYQGKKGAAVMWASPTKSLAEMGLKGIPTAPAPYTEKFDYMVNEAYMFDGLIGDPDPNLGNWLVDPAWNVILIDHSRAFTVDMIFPVPLRYIPTDLWNEMKSLTVESMTPALSPWLAKGDIKAIIQRRDKMEKMVDDLVKKYGAENVFVKKT